MLFLNKKIVLIIIILIIILLGVFYFFISNKEEKMEEEYQPQEEITAEQMRQTIISLYYENKETGELMPECRLIDVKTLLNNPYKILIEMLIAEPKNNKLQSAIPNGTIIKYVELKNDILYVDFSKEFIENHQGGEEKEKDQIEVFTKHVVDEFEAELNLFDESSGTRKLFGLLPFIAKSLLKGTTLVIDELDAKIHPVLLKYLIMTFSDMEKNKKGAQLIFTSHDLSTMNSEVFRRDEIWFVAKGNRQNSKLYSLVEFKNKKGESVRKDAKFDKQYLEGKYGADPYLRKIIDWGTVNG